MKENVYNVAIYCRVSTCRQHNSLGNQLDCCLHIVKEQGWEVYDVYSESITGLVFDRPELNRLLFDISQGKIDCVIVRSYDRLGRGAEVCEKLRRIFKEYDVRFISILEELDTLAGSLLFKGPREENARKVKQVKQEKFNKYFNKEISVSELLEGKFANIVELLNKNDVRNLEDVIKLNCDSLMSFVGMKLSQVKRLINAVENIGKCLNSLNYLDWVQEQRKKLYEDGQLSNWEKESMYEYEAYKKEYLRKVPAFEVMSKKSFWTLTFEDWDYIGVKCGLTQAEVSEAYAVDVEVVRRVINRLGLGAFICDGSKLSLMTQGIGRAMSEFLNGYRLQIELKNNEIELKDAEIEKLTALLNLKN